MIRLVLIFLILMMGCTSVKMIVKGRPTIYDNTKYQTRIVSIDSNRVKPFVTKYVDRGLLDSIRVNETEPLYFGKQVTLIDHLKNSQTKEFLIIKNDTIIYRYTDPDYKGNSMNTFSISKSMISLLLGAAIQDGFIKSEHELLTHYIPELKNFRSFDSITIGHALNMSSGLRFTKITGSIFKLMKSDEAKTYYVNDLRKYLSKSQREYSPGRYWRYNNFDTELIAWVIENATGKTVSAYFQERIWKNIGAENEAEWMIDQQGHERTHCCFYSKAVDIAKIGRLFLYPDNTVISEAWLSKIMKFDSSRIPYMPSSKDMNIMQHQYMWWKPNFPASEDIQANGVLGQFLYIDRASKIVMVKLSNKNQIGYPFRKIVSVLTKSEYKPQIPIFRAY